LSIVQLGGLRNLVQHCSLRLIGKGFSIHATDLPEFSSSCSSQCHGQQVGSARFHIWSSCEAKWTILCLQQTEKMCYVAWVLNIGKA